MKEGKLRSFKIREFNNFGNLERFEKEIWKSEFVCSRIEESGNFEDLKFANFIILENSRFGNLKILKSSSLEMREAENLMLPKLGIRKFKNLETWKKGNFETSKFANLTILKIWKGLEGKFEILKFVSLKIEQFRGMQS